MRRALLPCFVALCGMFASGPAGAAGATARAVADSELRWREAGAWRQSEGLPQDTVITILQTRDGYVWLGTRAGVSRFDGVRFTTFDSRDRTQLRENEVWDLVEGDDGALWIGVYGGGLSRLKDGQFTVYAAAKGGLVDDFVRVLAKDAAGDVWVGTDQGLTRLHDGTFTSYTVAEGLLHGMVQGLLPDAPGGGVWIATPGGLQRVVDGRIEDVRLPGVEGRALAVIQDLFRDRQGAVWIATLDGLLRVAEGTTRRYTTADGLSANAVRQLTEDTAGRLWIGTSAGLDRHRGAEDSTRPFTRVAAADEITALGADREGGIWVGYRGAGLARFDQGVFLNYTSSDGLPVSEVTTVLHGRGGTAWVGTAAGLSVLHEGRFATIGDVHGTVAALAEDRDGHLWVGTDKGLFRSIAPAACAKRCDPRFRALRDDASLGSYARVILADHSGAVWIGTDRSGLVKHQHGRLNRLTNETGPSQAIRALAEGRDGSLWIGTKGGGLIRLKDGGLSRLTRSDGLPNDSVQALYVDADQALWIATRQGLSRYKDGRFASYSVKDGLYWDHVYAIVEDDQGSLWMSCGKGVFRVSKRQLDDFAEGRAPSIISTVYGREHGLPSTMAAVGTYPGASKSADGRVWFAISGGLSVADPRHVATGQVPPTVHIEEIRIDARTSRPGAFVKAPPGKGDFMFRYTALSYGAPQAIRFKYRLEGFDADWVDAGARREAYYTNMPPGRYRFRAIACNNEGKWNEQGAEFSFSLAPHFHQTRWFYIAVALGLVLSGAGTQRLRVRRLKAREQQLSARVEEAVAQVKVLKGLLPTCAWCKKIRDESGHWNTMEAYIHERSEAEFSHGICPDCQAELLEGL